MCMNICVYHVCWSCDIARWVDWLGDVVADLKLNHDIDWVCIVSSGDDVAACTVGRHVDQIALSPVNRNGLH